ncbi:MAG TPA: hypothetical protein VG244_00270 [Acidimicrobiales bacterium]|nr:hypothetical protein [Acidimicrobiales bacterium]
MTPRAEEQTVDGTRRWALIVVAVIGVGLAAAPLAFGMFTKGPQGATMIAAFKPYMTAARIDGYQAELREINAGVHQTDTRVATVLGAGAGGQAAFDQAYPDFASFDQQWPSIDSTMTTLMNEVQGNLGNYQAVAALPSFKLFPWFFVIPGVLIAGVAIVALVRSRRRSRRWPRWTLVVLGVGLIAAPAAFQMFERAPHGGQMMTAFKNIETTQNVQKIQGYFGNMAVGQGAIRLDIVPALEHTGLTSTQIAARFPALATLDTNWVHILNDMTPMIGVMSDSIANYQAVASLPPFPLFPWFFVIPGVLVSGLALVALRPRAKRAAPAGADHGSGYEPISVPPSLAVPAGGVVMRRCLPFLSLAAFLVGGALAGTVPPAGATGSGAQHALVGTFKLAPGACFGAAVNGTYFRMIFPHGNVTTGKFFENPDSTCPNKTYTLAVPGAQGGLVTGQYQPNPVPVFNAQGGANANLIVQPQSFTAIDFSIATNKVDPQTGLHVPAPTISVNHGKLSGQIEAWSASWNKQYFNQGSPKPNGTHPGLTHALSGTYNATTHQFVITWTSQVVGGPFNGFTGDWHLSGTFVPAK